MLLIWNNEDNQLLSQVSLHDYSQIQIVDAVTSQEDDEEVSIELARFGCIWWIVGQEALLEIFGMLWGKLNLSNILL